jgi:AraC family transcriptional regulator
MPTVEIEENVGAQIPRWGPSASAPGAFAVWQRRPAGEIEYTAAESGVIFFFAPIGRYETRTGGAARREYPAAPGMIEVIPSGADTWARWNEHKDTAHFALSTAKLDEIARLTFDRDGAELLDPGRPLADPTIFQIACMLREEFLRGEASMSELYLDSLASLLAVHLLRHHSNLSDRREVAPPRRGGLSPHVRRAVLEYMEANLERGLTVAEMAAVASLAPNYFLRAFRQEMGTTPHRYLLALRVNAAERMLVNSKMDLAEIAYASGFSSQSHMTTAFRNLRGQTPGAYRSPFNTTTIFPNMLESADHSSESNPGAS